MDPEIKTAWLAALRSGDYKQGMQVLASEENGYCCLGVLCDLAEKAGAVTSVQVNSPLVDSRVKAFGAEEACSFLPVEVRTWAGIENHAPSIKQPYRTVGLHYLNDTGNTFEEIAKLIEEYF